MIGKTPRASSWLTIDQSRIDSFAAATGDDAFIHVDPERAANTRFGGTIAHGLLMLSILPLLLRSTMPVVDNARMRVNYGYDRVRFLCPVPVGGRIRGHIAIADVLEERTSFVRIVHDVEVELAGATRPALACRWLIGCWMTAP